MSNEELDAIMKEKHKHDVDVWQQHLDAFISYKCKQEAIGFARWCSENFYLDGDRFYHHDYQDKKYFTVEELYNLYLKSKT